MNDNKLILQIQRGNRRCADELVERYYSSILRYCSWHCYNTDRAEDLTQETFLRVFRDIYMYEKRGLLRHIYIPLPIICALMRTANLLHLNWTRICQ